MGKIILGVNSAYHEPAACLLQDGQIVAAVEEERFTRVRHGKRARVDNAHELPEQAIAHCIGVAGVSARDVTDVAYSLDPFVRRERNRGLPDASRMRPGDYGSPEGEEAFFWSNMEAKRILEERFPAAEFHFIEHHLCHAASAYTVSPLADAAILAIDGIGEIDSTWLGVGKEGQITELCRIPYPHSLGFVWEKMSELLGFDTYGGPGKMMGYGSITDARGELSSRDHLATMREVLRLNADGSFFVDNEVMRFRTADFAALERRFGPRRPAPVDRYEDASIAAALQRITEEAVINLANGLYRLANQRRGRRIDALCLAGGVALNCVANDRLLRETPFETLWIQPAANDAGTAVGAAAYVHAEIHGGDDRATMSHAFWGPDYDDAALARALDGAGLPYARPDDIAFDVAQRLDRGQIVAWFQGSLELGPRALGHRSILADPTRFDTRQQINTEVKMRESFRPFAPSVLAEAVPELFDLPAGSLPADFMLLACPLRDDRLTQVIPAVVQENGSTHRSTSRLHRVDAAVDPLYHHLIEEFWRRTGVAAVLNTSFNIGEPIVATPEQAIATFLRSRMSCLAMGPFLVERPR